MGSPKSDIDIFIGKKVKEKRTQHGMSQSDLAFQLGVSYGFIGQVESLKFPSKYSTSQLDRLAFIFKCSPKDFLPEKPYTKHID